MGGYTYTINHQGARATTAHPKGSRPPAAGRRGDGTCDTLSAQRGLTLIELMVGVGDRGALLVLTAAPYFGDYITNSRLREGGNLLLTEALVAQSEAIKRNRTVRLTDQRRHACR